MLDKISLPSYMMIHVKCWEDNLFGLGLLMKNLQQTL